MTHDLLRKNPPSNGQHNLKRPYHTWSGEQASVVLVSSYEWQQYCVCCDGFLKMMTWNPHKKQSPQKSQHLGASHPLALKTIFKTHLKHDLPLPLTMIMYGSNLQQLAGISPLILDTCRSLIITCAHAHCPTTRVVTTPSCMQTKTNYNH